MMKRYPLPRHFKHILLGFTVIFIVDSHFHFILPQKYKRYNYKPGKNTVLYFQTNKQLMNTILTQAKIPLWQKLFFNYISPYEFFINAKIYPSAQLLSYTINFIPRRIGPILKILSEKHLKNHVPESSFIHLSYEQGIISIQVEIPMQNSIVENKNRHDHILPLGIDSDALLILNNQTELLHLLFLHYPFQKKSPDCNDKQEFYNSPHLSNLLYRIHDFSLSANSDKIGLHLKLEAHCPNEIKTKQTGFILMTVRDIAHKLLLENGLHLNGDVSMLKNKFIGHFSIIPISETGIEL